MIALIATPNAPLSDNINCYVSIQLPRGQCLLFFTKVVWGILEILKLDMAGLFDLAFLYDSLGTGQFEKLSDVSDHMKVFRPLLVQDFFQVHDFFPCLLLCMIFFLSFFLAKILFLLFPQPPPLPHHHFLIVRI